LHQLRERWPEWRPEEAIGRSVNMLMPEGCRKAHDGYVAGGLRDGEANTAGWRREVEGRRKDGSVFSMECSVSDVRDGGKRLFIGMVRDITNIIGRSPGSAGEAVAV
jgi:two-component system, LuxR family, sensor kinase FixL